MVGVVPADIGEAYVNQHVAIARPQRGLNPWYLAAFVAAPLFGQAQLDALQRGATKAGLGLNDIRSLCIPLPPLGEQDEIVRRLDQLLSLADRIDERIDVAGARIDRNSRALLAKAFRGDLVGAGSAGA
jgi:type I restriction enzyme S subunit